MTASVDRAGPCEGCGAPRERGQRYCLECGTRAGTRGPQFDELLGRVRARCAADGIDAADRAELAGAAGAGSYPAPVPAATVPPGGSPAAGSRSRWSGLTLPSSRVSAALVLMFLAFGVIVGGVVGTPVQDTLAADAGRHVKLILPPAAAPAASTTATAPEAPSQPSSEPPAASSEPTPSAPAAATTPATGTKPTSGKSSSPSGSSGKGKGTGSGGGGEGGSTTPVSGGSSTKLPPVKHVFVIMLSDQPYASAFGPTAGAPYLSQTLEHKGELLVRYYAVAHQQLANGIALISGQGPTVETAANCPTYSTIAPAAVGADEQVTGSGCVYPSSTETLPGQLTAKHLTWRAYIEGMDEGAGGDGGAGAGAAGGACGHPALGAADPTSAATPPPGQTYATWRNPFVYFQSLTGSSACASNDVGLNKLSSDLSNPKSTPSFAYIAPDLCHDGSPTPCTSGAPAGMAAAEGFLKRVVPEITGSKAYKESGLLAITVDEAPSSGEFADSSSCCDQPQFPNLPASTSALGPPGGGQVGALLLSPYIAKSGVSQEPYNHFSLLRTIEDLFGLAHLGYAGLSKVDSFEPSIFSASPSSG